MLSVEQRRRRADREAAWRAANPEEFRRRQAAYRAANREKERAKAKAWRAANPERSRAAAVAYYAKNRQARKLYAEEEDVRARRRARDRAALRDPKKRLHGRISAAVRGCLRGKKGGKKWQELVGYSLNQLRQHLERQFTRGMTWANFGEWHIDHIRPVTSFNFTVPGDQGFRDCWALTNLRPLWAVENQKKRDKRLFLV